MSIERFLIENNWQDTEKECVQGDASSRQYTRLKKENKTLILMDSSKDIESLSRFIQVDEHLEKLGLSVPKIFAKSEKQGYLLIEDFGKETFEICLKDKKKKRDFYALAVKALITLHQIPQEKVVPENFRQYDPKTMLGDLELFVDMFMLNRSEEVKNKFRSLWLSVLEEAQCVPQSMLLRDYHVGNLMYLKDREGIQKCGILDFQDAYFGSITYDLVSLLQDARREIPSALEKEMKEFYLSCFPYLKRESFEKSYAILAGLRHARVLGAFRKLKKECNKPWYEEKYQEHVRKLFEEALSHPLMKELKEFYQQQNL